MAFQIGATLDGQRDARTRLEVAGVATPVIRYRNRIEVSVDASDVWRREPQCVAQLRPLDL